ncbi:type II toxin-antitoxin system RelE/ParE family toxin [Paenibacillus rigui]|uniref:Addiction module toxin RelE n=1 Tax=Paenibacillus rigui TaxID=554312 RepID=A0A229UI18_9BACL|nr:type II toxin-antitoxin system RelE/ParE family toxin [Paenibacillus rigui]OXM82945.1 hypothetical protein CF651_28480 [Paenibacillus rigui]
MFKVIVYEDDQGYSPFEKFYNELDEKARTDKSARGLIKKLNYCIGILSEGGTRAGEKFTKHIQGKLWELRPDDHRVFFFLWNGNHIVLLHSFRKETKKTPKAEIEKAQRELEDWVSRHGH